MKKGIFIIGCIVVLLCNIVLGVGGVVYFVLRTTPEKALDEAYDFSINGDYYKVEGLTKALLKGEGFSMKMRIVAEGEADIQSDRMYSKSTTSYDGVEAQVVETYYIEDDKYVSTDGGEYIKEEKEENVFEEITALIIDGRKYEILEDEEVRDEMCYQYEAKLDDAAKDILIEDFMRADDESDSQYKDMTMTDAYIKMWVSKDTQRFTKIEVTIDSIDGFLASGGEEIEISLEDIVMTEYNTDWGEEVTIEMPI